MSAFAAPPARSTVTGYVLASLFIVLAGVTASTAGALLCGDGFPNPGEECDDGNHVDWDGCQSDCRTTMWLSVDRAPAPGQVALNWTGGRAAFGIHRSDRAATAAAAASRQAATFDRTWIDSPPETTLLFYLVFSLCGNGEVDAVSGEQCDDGNLVDGDGCQANCQAAACGDGVLDPGEACDDGNLTDGDGCSSNCRAGTCGNGQVEDGEACDDGNLDGGDGCRADCTVEVCGDGTVDPGEECDHGAANSDSVPGACRTTCQAAACGDGVVDAGEPCDDGNLSFADACLGDCTLATCGDDYVWQGVEECDDGNAVETDSCRTGCIAAVCGDGILRAGVESCDDGNTIEGDACSARCRTNLLANPSFNGKASWTFFTDGAGSWTANGLAQLNITTEGSNVQLFQTNVNVASNKGYQVVFNGRSSGGQDLDLRLHKDTTPFTNYGLAEQVPLTDTNQTFVVPFTSIPGAATGGRFAFRFGSYDVNNMQYFINWVVLESSGFCGDAVVDPGEECDDGNLTDADACQSTCRLPACGDGVVDPGEECDDGNTADADGCQSTCRLPACGDGVLDAGEECDDGNTTEDDGCRGDCTRTCGNGVLEPTEECDLGALNSEAPDAACRTDCGLPGCGDGVLDTGEECDDGNDVLLDGCSDLCEIEPTVCGDGHLQPGEACDDGNNDPGDGCEPDCRIDVPGHFRHPRPGEIYREYTRVMSGNLWRVTDPAATFSGDPTNSPSTFLPNPQLPLSIGDLRHAVRAEVLLDVWGGHVGTTLKRMRFNGNPYINVPELTTTPTAGQCYMQQWNIVLDVPLGHLVQGSNIIEGTSGPQTCFGFNWGQWGWYALTVRVYYSAEKPHPVGAITAPASGVTLPENPTVTATAHGPAGIAQIDFLAYYEGVDFDGDGRYTEYHGAYHRTKNGTTLPLTRHVGTATTAPYRVNWNTQWVPDQAPGRIRMVARIKGGDGIWYVTPEVTGLSLERPGSSVRLYKPTGMPQRFWLRAGGSASATLTIPSGHDLAAAQAARLVLASWNGIDGEAEDGELHSTRLNNWVTPEYGENHFYKLDELTVPVSELRTGANTFTVRSDSTHHGMEILWPGPQLLVRYAVPLGPCGNGVLDAGETCDDGNVAAEDGCGATCQSESCGDGLAQIASGEQCDDGNTVDGDGCSADCLDETCGDGNPDVGEECDDGNVASGDGCSSLCRLEYCGDGRIQPGLGETCDAAGASTWKEPNRRYRVALTVSAGGFQRTDGVAETALNLQTLLTAAGGTGTARKSSLKLHEVDCAGLTLSSSVPFQFDGSTNGTLVWALEGVTLPAPPRHYELYFDTEQFTAPTFPDRVTVADNIAHAGQTSFRVQNPTGTFYFQKEAAGFSGLVDLDGNDWIGYSSAAGTAGEFRGIPNLVFPANIYHPGYTSASSTLVFDGPLKATIDSPSDDGTFKTRWEFYPGWARLTVQQATGNYWFLYEGTPGGHLDRFAPNNDILVRSDGTVYSVADKWTNGQDIPGDEWVYFGDPAQQRSLFLAHHTNDSQVDWYEPLDHPAGGPSTDWMTLFGFGRGPNASSWLSGYGRQFTLGLVETTEFATAERAIRSAYKPVPVTVGTAEARATITECAANCRLIGCGDGSVSGTEECDDGNNHSGDGCDATCFLEVCGNGVLQTGEECDDGNTVSGDGCSSTCQVESDCGNGTLEPGELCDDGNNVSGDGCSASCARFVSDDFDHAVLPSRWTFVNPRGDASFYLSGHDTPDARLHIVVPGGVSHDAWTPNNAPRLMHGADDGDFVLETRIEAAMSGKNQFQGIFVEQDASNWLRFDVVTDGVAWKVFAGKAVAGTASQVHSVTIGNVPSPNPVWLRVTRAGNTWTEEYSLDGSAWLAAGSGFVQALNVNKVGVFAGNAVNNVALTAAFDYLFDPAAPVVPEDGIACGNNSVETGETCDDGNTIDGDGCSATCGLENACGDGVLADGELCDDGNTANGDGCTSTCRTIVSDDFSAPALDPTVWTVVDPLGDTGVAVVGSGTAAAALVLQVAGGTPHDAWLPNNAPRVMQVADDSSFDVVVRLESPLWQAKAFQGILVEQDASNWIRFDVVSDGVHYVANAIRRAGSTPTVVRSAVLGPVPSPGLLYLRVTRVGNTWTYRYSTDGADWIAVGTSFTATLAVQAVGVMAGNAVTNPAFTARFDYFFRVDSPIVPEDPSDCGNGALDGEEACDAGGANSDLPGAICRTDCRIGGCGDGILDPGEVCDAAGYNADTPGAPCRTDCMPPGCGDGVVDPGEICDDGPANSDLPGASCRTDCEPGGCGDGVVDPGEECDEGTANSNAPDAECRPDCSAAGCGDGIRDGGEECDDGNTVGADGCSADCLLESGCGNSVVEPGEICDDGNTVGGDGCSAICKKLVSDDFSSGTLDPDLWSFVDPLGGSSVTVTGLGTANARAEISVAGGVAHDAWVVANAPRILQGADNSNFQVETKIESPTSVANQFQGILVWQDEDDWLRFDIVSDGTNVRAFAARATAGVMSTLRNVVIGAVPSPNPIWVRVNRTGNSWTFRYSTNGTDFTTVGASTFSSVLVVSQVGLLAGNAVTNTPFTARFDYFFDDASPIDPEDPTRCGDGVLDPGEECDDGAAGNSDVLPDACRSDCTNAGCGDGVLDAGEVCDDGGANGEAPGAACRTDCTPAGCGDGVVDPGEQCDDGAANSDTHPGACRTACVLPACGDAVTDPGEECDLGSANSEDPGDLCRTDCDLAGCGDDVVDPGEECDEGAENANAPDACRTDCSAPACGDLIVDTDETCDDGNTIGGDGCSAICLLETDCGNGVLDAGEMCDDGNTLSGDGCSQICRKIVSDDFDATVLDAGIWTIVDPRGDSSFTLVGTGTADAWLEIGITGATAHDAWVVNNAARVMQHADNSNFDIQTKFESQVLLGNQFQGLLIEEDHDTWLRFDLVSKQGGYSGFSARSLNGAMTVMRDVTLGAAPSPAPFWLRVTRSGNVWSFRYSTDGTTWTNVGANFTQALTVTRVGLMAGNGVSNPAFTARFDFFFDTNAPIAPEDAP